MSLNIFIARQPIHSIDRKVFAYKLKFQSVTDNLGSAIQEEKKNAFVLSESLLTNDLDLYTRGKKAIIEFNQVLLNEGYALLFPKNQLIIEIPETVSLTERLLEDLNWLKKSRYKIILNRQILYPENEKHLDLADFVKLDFQQIELASAANGFQEYKRNGIKFIVDNVETNEQVRTAYELGFDYFAGDFFRKPDKVEPKEISSRYLIYLQLLNEINRPDVTNKDLEPIIKRDVSLSYKLFKYLNFAHFGFPKAITSIKHALSLIGITQAKKLFSLVILSRLGENKSEELLVTSVIRANLCERVAKKVGQEDRASELFLMGMFSVLDALLDQEMSEILVQLPIAEDIKNALTGGKGIFRDIYELAILSESGKWDEMRLYIERLKLVTYELFEIILSSIKETNPIVHS